MVRTVEREEKLVDGPDAAHAELMQREDIQRRSDEELPSTFDEAVANASLQLRGELLGAVRMILARENLDPTQLNLPTLERDGLIALKVAVEGKSHDLGTFVYAQDRRDLLERALAVLQPDLTEADSGTARELRAQYDDLVQRVGELREHLGDLEDAQGEIETRALAAVMEEGATDTGDKPKPKPQPSDPDAPRPATTLTGPDRPEPARAPTTLSGPDRPEAARPATTLSGPDRPEPARPATTLSGPDRPESARPATTLTGPELAPEEAAQSTLGGEPEDAKKKPWWRRPFG
jgi:hypothetical protein